MLKQSKNVSLPQYRRRNLGPKIKDLQDCFYVAFVAFICYWTSNCSLNFSEYMINIHRTHDLTIQVLVLVKALEAIS